MNFANMTVGMRLGLGFALVIFAGLLVAVFGRLQLGAVEAEVTTLVENRMVKVEMLNQVKENLNVTARAVRNLALMTDEKSMLAEKQRVLDARVKNTALFKTLNESIKRNDAQAILQKLVEVRGPYAATIDKAMALGLENKGAEARDVLIKENRPLQAAYFKALDELVDLQKKTMQDSAKQVQSIASSTGVLMLIIAGVAAVLGGLIAWALTRSITRQLGGEPDYASNVAREIAAGNLSVEMQLRPGDQSSLLATMKTMRDSLAKVVSEVREGSESVATASSQISQGNHELSGRTEEQASALEQTAASMEQLSATVKQNADNARQANQLAQSASTVAVQGGDAVAQVVNTMKHINDSSKRIFDIISVIDGIAFQTNILALNAAVEAARAGEQGRGFAVVATEVRSLAGRSAEAAKEIKNLIGASVDRVEQGSALVDQAGVTMTEVVNSIRRVTDLMGEISAASSEQSAGVTQVGEAVMQMDQVTQQNAALVEESAAAADSLKTQAQQLVQAVSIFKLPDGLARANRSPEKPANRVMGGGQKTPSAFDRRGPSRATNVSRLPAKPAAAHKPRQIALSASGQNGTTDWESF